MRRRGRVQGRAEGVRASALGLGAHSRRMQRHGKEAGARISHGGGAASAWKTRGHEVEHVAGVIHLILEAVLGLITCQMGLWSLKQSCSSPDAVQLLFRFPIN